MEQQESLVIRAPLSGQVISDDLAPLMNTFVSPGHLICSIGTRNQMGIRALISQHDFDAFHSKVGEAIDVHIWGYGPWHFSAKLEQVNPRAQSHLPHPAFSATNGGPVDVMFVAPTNGESVDHEPTTQANYEMVAPRFLGEVRLPANNGSLKAGQLGFVSFRTHRATVGEVVSEMTTQWLRKMRHQNQRQE